MNLRVGHGYDVHQLKIGENLNLGGIHISHNKGSFGHSDADVLIHSICDALLGAANMRDIGYHFSDKDPIYKGIDSKILLEEVKNLIQKEGFFIVNIDCTIVLEKPKLSSKIPLMKSIISEILNIEENLVSLKATTHENVDSFGNSKAIKAYAVCLLNK